LDGREDDAGSFGSHGQRELTRVRRLRYLVPNLQRETGNDKEKKDD
jgi:hypothetical protein